MDSIKSYISQFGLLAAALGIMSALLYYFNYNVKLLMWVDQWGETTGWIIRGALIVGGGLLFLLTRGNEEDEEEE